MFLKLAWNFCGATISQEFLDRNTLLCNCVVAVDDLLNGNIFVYPEITVKGLETIFKKIKLGKTGWILQYPATLKA